MTVAEFEARLGRFGESIENMQPTLDGIAQNVEDRIKSDYGRNGLKIRSRDLYDSIDVKATNNDTISIGMLSYGLYNNYGVLPKTTISPTEFGLPVFSGQWGLPARNFFREAELNEMIANEIALEITEQF